MAKRYWASRPDRNNLEYFWNRLQAGELRQGWGSEDSQNLDRLRDAQETGEEDWWDQLSQDAKDAYRNYPFNTRWEDSMRSGDLVLVPNLPTWGYFSIVRMLDDEYHYDIDPDHRDYGHWRRVELMTPASGINWSVVGVSAAIRSTVRTRSRIWRVDHLADTIDELMAAARLNPDDYRESTDPAARFQQLVAPVGRAARSAARAAARSSMSEILARGLHAAELELAVSDVLGTLYPGATIEHTAGVQEAEHGTDLLIRIFNPLEAKECSLLIAVQVKNHSGETSEGVEQLEMAAEYWRKPENAVGGRLVGLALVTTAERVADSAQARIRFLEKESGLPVHIVTRKDLIELFVEAALHVEERFFA